MRKGAVCMVRLLSLMFTGLLLSLSAAEQEQLHQGDIQQIMQKIFAQHVEKKGISSEILKTSFNNFIDQFDPDGIYLTQVEITPYTAISSAELSAVEKQYKAGDYHMYASLNEVIQKAIARARSIRSQLEKNPKALYQQALTARPGKEFEHPVTYPANEQELRERIRNHLVDFLHSEIKRYGQKGVEGYETQAIALYERQLRSLEDQYIYRQPSGEMLTSAEQENLFTLHVLKALAKSLDAHTAFFDPEEAYDMRVRLEKGFDGIGIVFQQSPRGVVVAHIVEGGPAAKNGQVRTGDILMEINGVNIDNQSFDKAMELLKNGKDDSIAFVFNRLSNGDEAPKIINVTLKRAAIVMSEDRVDVSSEQFGNGVIGRVTLHSFYQNDQGVTSEKDLREAIKKLDHDGNLRGLILDLRENSGGFLSQAVKVAGLFITNGVVVVSKYSSGDEKIYRDMDSKIFYDGPLVVLTSRATASAAEIVAQALQDYGVALIVGDEQTYGKGTIQSQTVTDNVKNNAYFKVTVGKYYTVSGKTPQIGGVKADIVVPGPYSNLHLGEEYLEHTLNHKDTIAAEYNDALKDIDPGLRPWYLKYYMPTIQHQKPIWHDLLGQLRKNSTYRLGNNKNYQLFLKRLNAKEGEEEAPEDNADETKTANGDFGATDLQLSEAMNIIKDMIYLQSAARQRDYMVGPEAKTTP